MYSLPNDGPPKTSEPVYNVLDKEEPNTPAEKEYEPVYNVLEQSGEEKREPVYSVLTDN